jgi:hypothetical protein
MSVITSGPTRTPWLVNLAAGQGFSQPWEYHPNGATQSAQPWPVGSSGFMKLSYTAPGSSTPTYTGTWSATVNGSIMAVNQSSAVTDLVPDGSLVEMWMDINDGSGPQLVMSGSAVRVV